MIAFQIQGEFLDLQPDSSFTIKTPNPLFSDNTIPGSLIYPFSVQNTPRTRRLLGFPHLVASENLVGNQVDALLWLGGLIWKQGKIIVRSATSKAFQLNFQSDAGDVQSRIKDVSLRDMLASVPGLARDFQTAIQSPPYNPVTGTGSAYTAFPILNPDFDPDKKATVYVNYYDKGFKPGVQVPYFYLVYVLEKAFASIGYQLTGSWIEDVEIQRLVLYNNQVLASPEILVRNHVPDVKFGQLLVELQKLFPLGYVFDTVGKTVEIAPVPTLLRRGGDVDWTAKADADYELSPVEQTGYTLLQNPDSSDELSKAIEGDWNRFVLGEGKETIATDFSPLQQSVHADQARSWSTPHIRQKGSSTELGQNQAGLHLCFYRGLQADSEGNLYPQGGYESESYSLRYRGENGLYEKWWKPCLEFRSAAKQVERTVRLDLVDLLNLDVRRKIYLEGNLYFFQEVTLTVSQKSGIKPAKVTLLRTRT